MPTPQFATGYIEIPDTTLPNGSVVPSFVVGQYYCSKASGGKATVSPIDLPWVDITYEEAAIACKRSGGSLITERQCLAIATRIAADPRNWIGGVESGTLKQGLHNGSVSSPQPGNYTPPDPIEDRWFYVTDNDKICDFAGNIFGWAFDDVQGNRTGVIDRAISAQSISITSAPFPSLQRGMGKMAEPGYDWEGMVMARGGGVNGGDNTGVFRMRACWPTERFDHIGFRMVRSK